MSLGTVCSIGAAEFTELASALSALPAHVVWKVGKDDLPAGLDLGSLGLGSKVKVRHPSPSASWRNRTQGLMVCRLRENEGPEVSPYAHASMLFMSSSEAAGVCTVQVVQWAPQNDLLGSGHVKAFLTHGGINGLYEVGDDVIQQTGLPRHSTSYSRTLELHSACLLIAQS